MDRFRFSRGEMKNRSVFLNMSIIQTERPKRNNIEISIFDIILNDNAVWYVLYLLVSFLFASNFKRIIADKITAFFWYMQIKFTKNHLLREIYIKTSTQWGIYANKNKTITGPCSEKSLIIIQLEQSLLSLSKSSRAHSFVTLEEGAKMGLVLEPELIGYFLNGFSCGKEQL